MKNNIFLFLLMSSILSYGQADTLFIPKEVKENVELEDLQVVSKGSNHLRSKVAMLNTEKINRKELEKAACCNISESFSTNPSVDVSYSDAATGAKQIKLLGLSGAYIQLQTENIPNLRGLSSNYGMDFIPGTWMESIQITKGSGSVMNGYESMTGQINVEYKKPFTADPLSVNVYANDAGRIEANTEAAVRLNPHLGTALMLHFSDDLNALDDNKDGYLDIPMKRQYNLLNRWFYQKNGYTSQVFFKAVSDKRNGGTVDNTYNIDIDTERYEIFVKNGYVFNSDNYQSLGLILSGSSHSQDAKFEHGINNTLDSFNGNQKNLYLNLIYDYTFKNDISLKTGISVNYDKLDELFFRNLGFENESQELTPGVFAELHGKLNEVLHILAGVRIDNNSNWGWKFTPRASLKYVPSEHFQWRLNAGRAFKTAYPLSEYNYFLASNRQFVFENNYPFLEQSWNFGTSLSGGLHIFEKELEWSGEWYYTNFTDQLIADVDNNPHEVLFYQLNGKSYSSVFQFETGMDIIDGLNVKASYRIMDVKSTYSGILREKPLQSRYKGLLAASYKTPFDEWQFDITAQFNGGGRMPDPEVIDPMWKNDFKPFTVYNVQVTRNVKNWSLYSGVENIFNFVQTNPIIDASNPSGENFDATLIWGPTHGRKIYVGLRWNLKQKEDNNNH